MQIFDWKNFKSWKTQFESSVLSIYSIKDLTIIFENSEHPTSEIDDYIKEDICKVFWKQFDRIKSYHASKPVIPKEIHDKGLNPLDIDNHIKIFKDIFKYETFKITDEDINHSLSKIVPKVRNGFLFVVLDDRNFEDQGHYLVHGSEFILVLTMNLPPHINSIEMTDVLLKRGQPTIYELLVPVQLTDSNDRKDLINYLLVKWYYLINHSDDSVGVIDYSFCLTKSIKPECVVAHYHPKSVRNPHSSIYGPMTYEPVIECSICDKNI